MTRALIMAFGRQWHFSIGSTENNASSAEAGNHNEHIKSVLADQWMYTSSVRYWRSWKTILVFLTKTNNPCVTLPISLTACIGGNVGGVLHCVLSGWGLKGSEFHKGETHIHEQAVYSPTLYIRLMGKSAEVLKAQQLDCIIVILRFWVERLSLMTW